MTFGVLHSAFVSVAGVTAVPQQATTSQIVLVRSALEKLADVSTILIALVILILLGALTVAVLELRKGQRKVAEFISTLRVDLAPAISNVNDISRTLGKVSDSVADRVDSFDGTLEVANDRLRRSVDMAYDRIRDFDALLRVAQEEAEGAFFSATSAIRGFSRGASAMRGGASSRRRRGRARRGRRASRPNIDPDSWDRHVDLEVESDDPGSTRGRTFDSGGPRISRRRQGEPGTD